MPFVMNSKVLNHRLCVIYHGVWTLHTTYKTNVIYIHIFQILDVDIGVELNMFFSFMVVVMK